MIDTDPATVDLYHRMLLGRSGGERLRMACSMYGTARAFVRAAVLARDPSASPAAVREAIFQRFYGHEFDAVTRAKILRALRAERRPAN